MYNLHRLLEWVYVTLILLFLGPYLVVLFMHKMFFINR